MWWRFILLEGPSAMKWRKLGEKKKTFWVTASCGENYILLALFIFSTKMFTICALFHGHSVHTNFHNNWFRHTKIDRHIGTKTAWWPHNHTFLSLSLSLSLSLIRSSYTLIRVSEGFFFLSFFFNHFTDDRTPWTRDWPVARPLPKHRTT
jgi:hypothetical protein